MSKMPELSSSQEHPQDGSHRERFRPAGAEGFYPERIVKETPRVLALRKVIDNTVAQLDDPQAREGVNKRLFDLVIHNAYGNIFPPVNSAGDAIGIPDESYGEKFKNCVVLVVRKKDLTLAPAGGFNDVGEALTQTIAREAREETQEKLSSSAVIGVLSDPARDGRFTVVSTLAAGIVDPTVLHASDDAAQVVIVPLVDASGNLNESFKPGTYTDVTGKTFTHNGFFAGHDKSMEMLYRYWENNGKSEGLSLSQTMKKMSSVYPQDWFEGYEEHPAGTDNYPVENVGEEKLLMTPNVRFAWQQATKIFTDVHIPSDEAASLAKKFVYNAVHAKATIDGREENVEVLPLFPQPSVTADCLLITGENKDRLVVERRADGELRLPGSFYSPEHTDKGRSLEDFITSVVGNKFNISLTDPIYVGPVGGKEILGRNADRRFPRISHTYTDFVPDTVELHNSGLPEGSELITIPIWADETHTTFSEEIMQGKWGFDHNEEIIQPLVGGAISLLADREKAQPRIVHLLTRDTSSVNNESMGEIPSQISEADRPQQKEIPPVDTANVLAQVFKEVTDQHKGRGTNTYGRENTYGQAFEFHLKGPHGDVHLGVGTKEPLFEINDTAWIGPLAPFALPRGLYVIPHEGKHTKPAYSARSVTELLQNQRINDGRDVLTQVVTGLQHFIDKDGNPKPYKFSEDLSNQIRKLGIEGFVDAYESKEVFSSLEAKIGGYKSQIALLGPTADGGKWRDGIMDMLMKKHLSGEIKQARKDVIKEAQAEGKKLKRSELKRQAYLRIKDQYFFDPVINEDRSGRRWGHTPDGGDFDDATNEAENIFDDAVSALYFTGEVDEKYSGVGSLAEGVGSVAATTIMRGKKLVILIEPSDEGVKAYIKKAREQARRDLDLMAQTNPDNIIIATSFKDLAEKTWKLRHEMLHEKTFGKTTAPMKVRKREATVKYPDGRHEVLSTQNLICISGTSRADAAAHNQLVAYWKSQGIPVRDTRRTDFTLDIYGNEEVPQKFVARLNVVTVEPDKNGNFTSYAAIKDLGNAMWRALAAEPPTHTILYMPEDTNDAKSDYARARKLVISQHKKLCEEFPQLTEYIHITTKVEDVQTKSKEIMDQFREEFTFLPEKGADVSKPENFRGPGEEGYFPDRIVGNTPRRRMLESILDTYASAFAFQGQEKVAAVKKRLFDLMVYNAYANIYPPMHTAGDGVGVPNEVKYATQIAETFQGRDLTNCVTLVKRKDGTLTVAGGFIDPGEGPEQVITRETLEETGARGEEGVIFGVNSRPNRDPRFAVVAPAGALNTDATQLKIQEGSDAVDVIVLKLFDEQGNFLFGDNPSGINYSKPGTYTNLRTGESFEHKGMFASHDETLRQLYEYWQQYGQKEGLTLSQTIQKMSQYYPQPSFGDIEPHTPESETYPTETVEGHTFTVPPNLQFARDNAEKIFRDAGMTDSDAKRQAKYLMYDLSTKKISIDGHPEEVAELLPRYPEPAVTIDCLILTGPNRDKLLLEEFTDPNGEVKYRLPGTFYSQEHFVNDASVEQASIDVVKAKYNADFKPLAYLGAVGGKVTLGYNTDTRNFRTSQIFVGTIDGKFSPNKDRLRPGSRLVEVPILGEDGKLSRELLYSRWDIDHGFEIVHPYILRALKLLQASK